MLSVIFSAFDHLINLFSTSNSYVSEHTLYVIIVIQFIAIIALFLLNVLTLGIKKII